MRTLFLLAVFGCEAEPTSAVTDAQVLDGSTPDAAWDAGPDAALDATSIPAADAAPDAGPLGGPDRPALIFVPSGEAPSDGWPLLFVLHGFRAHPELMRRQFPFDRRIDAHGWVVVYPHGGRDADGFPFWQAHERVPDEGADVPYLLALADEVAELHPIDPQRFFVLGHSNGGAMAHSLACHAPDRLAGFANISGYNVAAERCAAAAPMVALHICGADDPVYAGPAGYPGVEASAAWWAETVLGCTAAEEAPPADFTTVAPGAETAIRRWIGCPTGTTAERWRLDGIGHVIVANDSFLDAVHRAFTSVH